MGKRIGIDTRGGRNLVRAAAVAVALLGVAGGPPARAATYLPIPDPILAGNAPVIVHARAGESAARLQTPGSGPEIVTVTELEVLEVLKGKVTTGRIRLVLPGGQVEDRLLWIPGRPSFVPGQEVLLFIAPVPDGPGEYGPTELALSVFDVLEDPEGRRFAVRTIFQVGEEEVLDPSGRGEAEPDHVRDLGSFIAALRAVGKGGPMPAVQRISPAGPLKMSVETSDGVRPLWVNIGGVEPGSCRDQLNNVISPCLFRWNWNGTPGCPVSANGVVNPVGAQTNLSDASNGHTHVQNTATAWSGISGTDVRYSYSSSSGNVDVNLDVTSVSGGWSTAMDCALGVVGLGGPGSSSGPCSFKGQAGYFSPSSGNAWMRKSICATGYPADIFRSAVLHEVGHTLGLGHPDQGTSNFSTTSSSEWDAAVMRSSIPPARPDTPQSDDIAAVRYYYGTAALPPAPVASFTFSPAAPQPGQSVQFTDTSSGGPTSWSWSFGDPGAGAGNVSTLQNPVHVYGLAGAYTATLTASNAFGSSTTTRQVTVASAANRDPVAVADSYAVASGGTLSVDPPGVLTNDSDPDGDGLTAALVSPPGSGSFGLQTSGAFVYTPAAGFVGTAFFTYRASDGRGGVSSPATVTITVTPSEAERVVPIVLDAFGVGASRFRSELVLANRGNTQATVDLTYTAASALNAGGSGTVTETLAPGRQLVLDDALAYLRTRGLVIPQAVTGASQGGTLRARFRNLSSPDAGAAFARTTALLPEGRAGVAYPAVAPAEWQAASAQHVFGLRETALARSNLALVNVGSTGDIGLRVTLSSGPMGDRRTYLLPETIWLQPLQWTQIGSVLARAGFTNGWAVVERISGTSPFYAYGVFNDYGTNDGSFIDPIPAASNVPARTVPVVLELGIYSTELILANPTASTVAVTLSYVESLAASGVARRPGTDLLQPREQKIVEAIPHLRALGVDVGPAGGSYAGSLVARFTTSGQPANGFVGARTKSPGQPEGTYGVYYSGLGTGQMAASEAWVYGLKQDGDSRTNLAVVHAEPGGAPVTLQAEVFDGETGRSVGGTGNRTLAPGEWFQWNQILGGFGLRQGYVRVFRVFGTSPFLAYGVVNDGGSSRPGTNDGSYIPMLPAR